MIFIAVAIMSIVITSFFYVNNKLDYVKALVNLGSAPNSETYDNDTCIAISMRCRKNKIFDYILDTLLKEEASDYNFLNKQDLAGNTLLHHCLYEKNSYAFTKLMELRPKIDLETYTIINKGGKSIYDLIYKPGANKKLKDIFEKNKFKVLYY